MSLRIAETLPSTCPAPRVSLPPPLPTIPPTCPLPYQRVRGRESLYTPPLLNPKPAPHKASRRSGAGAARAALPRGAARAADLRQARGSGLLDRAEPLQHAAKLRAAAAAARGRRGGRRAAARGELQRGARAVAAVAEGVARERREPVGERRRALLRARRGVSARGAAPEGARAPRGRERG